MGDICMFICTCELCGVCVCVCTLMVVMINCITGRHLRTIFKPTYMYSTIRMHPTGFSSPQMCWYMHMEGEEDREMANVEQFVTIMDAYLQSFLQAEIELFREISTRYSIETIKWTR